MLPAAASPAHAPHVMPHLRSKPYMIFDLHRKAAIRPYLSRCISSCQTVANLSWLLGTYLERMDHKHIACAIVKLARLALMPRRGTPAAAALPALRGRGAPRPGVNASSVARRRRKACTAQLVARLGARLLPLLGACGSQELAGAAWGLGRLHRRGCALVVLCLLRCCRPKACAGV